MKAAIKKVRTAVGYQTVILNRFIFTFHRTILILEELRGLKIS